MIDEIKEIQKGLNLTMDKLMKIQNAALSTLPESHQKEIAPLRADMKRILDSIKSGDVNAINQIKNKYVNSNR